MSTETTTPVDALDPRLNRVGLMGTFKQRMSNGQLGSLPVFIGLIILMLFFSIKEPAFHSAFNISNLTQQVSAYWGFISLGITLVLLLGEIDLSAASVSGLGAAVVAVLAINHHYPLWQAMIAGVITGTFVGLAQGTIITKLGLPSFVVTLAGLLGWNGLMLYVLGSTGNINLAGTGLVTFAQHEFLPPVVAYALAIGIPLVLAILQLLNRGRRVKAGLTARSVVSIVVVDAIAAAVLAGIVYFLNTNNGVSDMFVLMLAAYGVVNFVLIKTRAGRNIFAVGGNVEAARRSGINVTRVKLGVFITASSLAAFGGILSAGYQGSVSQSSGGGDLLINAIAACVIGGVSLFGGRGSVWSTLIGLFVVGVIANGLPLLNLTDASVQYMITGAVLLFAVVLDGIARRGQVKR